MGIDNSKLYCCDGLWQGIVLEFLSSVATYNDTQIEDAEKAIYASGLCALTIQQTTFNRNRIGVELNTPFPNIWVPGPLVWSFTDNRFTCSAPLNGTIDEITEAGVKLKNSSLYAFQSGTNTFSDLKYGIYTEGTASAMGMRGLIMDRIRKDGIFMEYGTLRIRNSFFTDCHENAVNIASARSVDIGGGGQITLTTALPNVLNLVRNGISISSFALNAQVYLSTNINANVPNTDFRVRGIYLKGGDVGAGTQITVEKSNFVLRTYYSAGIFLDGLFPETGQIDIFNNDFDCASYAGSNVNTYGIESEGKINELHIFGNRFNTSSGGWVSYGMELKNSEGINNEVSNNQFYPDASIIYVFLKLDNFQNTKVCSNIGGSLGPARAYYFWNTCTGMDFTGNETYATGAALDIFTSSMIGPQSQRGNKWYPIYAPCNFDPSLSCIYRSVPQAVCQTADFVVFNKFTVHTDQSVFIENGGFGYYDFFSEFHPESVVPDQMDEFFFIDPSGSPSVTCIDRFSSPGGDDELERRIADNTLPTELDNPAMGWNARSYLYKKLARNPLFSSGYSSFPTFVSQNTNNNIGRFYEVSKLIEDAFAYGATEMGQSEQALSQISILLGEIELIDPQIEYATSPTALAALKQQKEDKISQIRGIQSTYQTIATAYDAHKTAKRQQALLLNQQVAPNSQLETNQKSLNSIYLQSMLNQGGLLTTDQTSNLQWLVQQDPKLGGMAVGQALSILSNCAKAELNTQPPSTQNIPTPVAKEIETKQRSSFEEQYDQKTWLSPNPATSELLVNSGISGTLTITDLNGRAVVSQKITGTATRLNINFTAGLYIAKLLCNDGSVKIEKIVIQKH